MARVVAPFPVVPGKTAEDAKGVANKLKGRPGEYAESRRKQGVTLERAYLQTTPMGMFVVAYVESTKPFAETNAALAQSDLDIDREFLNGLKEIHGFDATQPPEGPAPETIGEWFDPNVTRRGRGMAFCAPINPGMEDRTREFIREAFSRPEFAESRRNLRQNGEVVTLIITPQGPVAAVYLEGEDSFEGNRRFAASQAPFDVWFRDGLKPLVPPFIDFGQPVPGVEEIFDSEAILARA